MLKERMTPEEIAHLTGFSRQTINKWARKEGWKTSLRPGVQGGKAHLIHINEQVREFIRNAQHVAESMPVYQATQADLPPLLTTLIKELTADEQKQLISLLLREGIRGVLQRLGIRNQ
ncbi:putative DNA-binding transcriptional regulator [Enterobacteriaceae bacterium ESL0689]|nr:putative DNA-binding transcriptional regulator [Enterobacteriaceae bacterium ESL0689]